MANALLSCKKRVKQSRGQRRDKGGPRKEGGVRGSVVGVGGELALINVPLLFWRGLPKFEDGASHRQDSKQLDFWKSYVRGGVFLMLSRPTSRAIVFAIGVAFGLPFCKGGGWRMWPVKAVQPLKPWSLRKKNLQNQFHTLLMPGPLKPKTGLWGTNCFCSISYNFVFGKQPRPLAKYI